MIKPFLGQGTLDKIKIFGSDPKVWKAALLQEIDANQLPVHYGGSATDPDGNPMCLSKVIRFFFHFECSFKFTTTLFVYSRSIWAAKFLNLITSKGVNRLRTRKWQMSPFRPEIENVSISLSKNLVLYWGKWSIPLVLIGEKFNFEFVKMAVCYRGW